MEERGFKTILFYQYCHISLENVKIIKERELSVCKVLGLTGRIIIAKEGINGTLEGNGQRIEIKDITKFTNKIWIT